MRGERPVVAGADDALAAVRAACAARESFQQQRPVRLDDAMAVGREGDRFMRTITVGVLGAGRIGRIHTENLFRMAGVRVKSIADPTPISVPGRPATWQPAPNRSWCSTIQRSRRS